MASADFPGALVLPRVCARQPGLGCLRDLPCFGSTLLPSVPSPLRREEDERHPRYVPTPRGFPQHNSASAPPATPHQLPLGMCVRRCSVRFMLWPAGLLALLDWSDLECPSGRRGRVHPSLPEVGHPHPESGMTTPPFWGRTMTGLAPAGALPLQAARFVANFAQKVIPGQLPLSVWRLSDESVELFGRSAALFVNFQI